MFGFIKRLLRRSLFTRLCDDMAAGGISVVAGNVTSNGIDACTHITVLENGLSCVIRNKYCGSSFFGSIYELSIWYKGERQNLTETQFKALEARLFHLINPPASTGTDVVIEASNKNNKRTIQ